MILHILGGKLPPFFMLIKVKGGIIYVNTI